MVDDPALVMRANRMDIVGRWADDLAHEIKNPLHAMVINLELVKRRAATGEPAELVERAEVVEAELHRVNALVDSLLRLVRPWPDRPFADVDAAFETIMPVVTARARVRRIRYAHRAADARVNLSPGDLVLLILNLLDNAIDATPADGEVATTCEVAGDDVVIRVVDSGTGLDPELGGDPLTAGVSSRPGRAGLGLAVSAALARRAGGRLRLDPADDAPGTAAVLTLPRAGSA